MGAVRECSPNLASTNTSACADAKPKAPPCAERKPAIAKKSLLDKALSTLDSLLEGTAYAYDSYEHESLCDAAQGPGIKLDNEKVPTLTYGQVCFLQGDFYDQPEEILKAPPKEVACLLAAIDEQSAQAAANGGSPTPAQATATNDKVEKCTARREYDSKTPGVDKGKARGSAGDTYLDLASHNELHFSPENQHTYSSMHQDALDLAQKSYEATDPAEKAKLLNLARLKDAGSLHYLTDAFASGHFISGSETGGRAFAKEFYDTHKTEIAAALTAALGAAVAQAAAAAKHRGWADRHPIAGWPYREAVALEEWWVDNSSKQVGDVLDKLSTQLPSVLLKLVHDRLNAEGLRATNSDGTTWDARGDDSLVDTPAGRSIAENAVRLSREELETVASHGKTALPTSGAALQFAPERVEVGTAGKTAVNRTMTIAEFAGSKELFWDYLGPLVLDSTPNNKLLALIKGSIPTLDVKVKEVIEKYAHDEKLKVRLARR